MGGTGTRRTGSQATCWRELGSLCFGCSSSRSPTLPPISVWRGQTHAPSRLSLLPDGCLQVLLAAGGLVPRFHIGIRSGSTSNWVVTILCQHLAINRQRPGVQRFCSNRLSDTQQGLHVFGNDSPLVTVGLRCHHLCQPLPGRNLVVGSVDFSRHTCCRPSLVDQTYIILSMMIT